MSAPFASEVDAVTRATVAPRDGDRAAARARALPLIAALAERGRGDLHLAAALGDAATVARIVAADHDAASRRGGPFNWEPLTQLAFSSFVEEPDRQDRDFVAAARALLEAGADAKAGFDDPKGEPGTQWRCALYAASALARHEGLTRLLLAHGADPNDEEASYHAPEGYDLATMQALVESGHCSPDTLATMLLRKCDWHDVKGVRWLLEHGADASRETRWNKSILQHALDRDDSLEIILMLLDHGADPLLPVNGRTALAQAARLGRGDVLDAIARRAIRLRVDGVDALLAACARGHTPAVATISETMPATVDELHPIAAEVLVRFAGNGNSAGLRLLLQLGLPVDARLAHGHGYFGIAPMSTALHAAAWRGWPAAVRALVGGGADVHARDGRDRTPLMLAVKACVDSYWTDRRSPESVEVLLEAGARTDGIPVPCGYDAVDALLARPAET